MNKLELCKNCTHRKFSMKEGVVCGMTNAKPDFEHSCSDFKADGDIQMEELIKPKKPLKSNRRRATAAQLFLWIMLGVEILWLVSTFIHFKLLKIVEQGNLLSFEAASLNSIRIGIISLLMLTVYVVSIITFILWFRRAYYNLHQKVDTLSYANGWAVGSWFVPIVNLYRPFEIMRELYGETISYFKDTGESSKQNLLIMLPGIWWVSFILMQLFSMVLVHFTRNAITLDLEIASTLMNMTGSGMMIIFTLLTIRLVSDYARVEGFLAAGQEHEDPQSGISEGESHED